jgi:hypothetical protein
MVGQIEALPRRSTQRTARFFDMHRELASAAARSEVMRRWQERLRDTQSREKEEQVLFDRELFYAMQPRERLVEMIGRYGSLVKSGSAT